MPFVQNITAKILGESPQALTEPEKELRFTRSRQGVLLFLTSTLLFAIAIAIVYLAIDQWGMDEPILKGYMWIAIFPFLAACILLRVALRCLRHAYILLTPMGVEIFPFWKPEKNLQIIYWQEITAVDITKRNLTLHFNETHTSGVVISLNPIHTNTHLLLKTAIEGRMKSTNNSL